MENLYEALKDIYCHTKSWDYYKNRPNDLPTFSVDECFAKDFIQNYFNLGEKKHIFDFLDELAERNLHTVLTFFIGIMLKEGLLKDKFAKATLFQEGNENIFLYCWFITCLFHDYGYIIENNKEKYPPNEYDLVKIRKKLKIANKFDYIYNTKKYDRETVGKYFNYIKSTRGRLDHGIIGGYLLYDKLIKNFNLCYKKAKDDDPNISRESFTYKDLEWSESDFQLYAEFANAILAHNIWLAYKPADKKKYKEYWLEKLIINKPEDRVSPSTHPLLFLLALADSIEPTKRIPTCNPESLLQKLNFVVDGTSIIIQVLDECINYTNWFNGIEKLKDWMKVHVKQECNEINITINKD